jgi:hypothetical protein
MANILFICGSLNQTTQMHTIAKQLEHEHECYFTPYYGDGLVKLLADLGWLDFTVLGGRHRRETDEYLASHHLKVDLRGEKRKYDLVITCSDLIVQKNIRNTHIVLVQEGITEPESLMYKLVKWFKLPRYLANTSTSGLSDAYDIFCVASEGYAEHFIRKDVRPEKIAVTGIPNFDNMQVFCDNDFPLCDYVLVATSPLRETFRFDNRKAFIKKCVGIAGEDPLIFKLHPLENAERATNEIRQYASTAVVLTNGNIGPMIANAKKVITQQSTSTFVAVALGKEVHTNLNIADLKKLMPIQNGGTSATHIARICSSLLLNPSREQAGIRTRVRSRVAQRQS